jgi:GDP-4-dehydro-6-deoxy-D-mannose reductase
VRVLVTGSAGFAGRWLMSELRSAGHVVTGDRPDGRRVDIVDRAAIGDLVDTARPDLVLHLAAVSFGPDAQADPNEALRVNVGGTAALLEVLGRLASRPALVVVSSSDVYGSPADEDLPLDESAPTLPERAYGLSKLGQESVAIARAGGLGLRVVVARPFNHTGPGQPPRFAVPAFAARILAARSEGHTEITAGNIDVRRDFGDVRDTVRAYRLLGEALVDGSIDSGRVFNIATGLATRIGDLIDRLAVAAGHPVTVRIDPALVRSDDPPCIVGDAGALHALTGWAPEIPLERTLSEILAAAETSD